MSISPTIKRVAPTAAAIGALGAFASGCLTRPVASSDLQCVEQSASVLTPVDGG